MFSMIANGGVRFITESAENPNVTYIPGNSAGWTITSSRAVNTNIDPVDPENALAGVEELEVATCEYGREDGERDERIGELETTVETQREELAEKYERIAELEADSEQKNERIADLESRLAAVED